MPETTTLADWLWTSYRYLNWAQEDYVTMHRIPNDVYEVYPFQSNDPKYKVVESVVNNRLTALVADHNKGQKISAAESLEPHEIERLMVTSTMDMTTPTGFMYHIVFQIMTLRRLSRGGAKNLRKLALSRFRLLIKTFPDGTRALAVNVQMKGFMDKTHKAKLGKLTPGRDDIEIFDDNPHNWAPPGQPFPTDLTISSLPTLIAVRKAAATPLLPGTSDAPLFVHAVFNFRGEKKVKAFKESTGKNVLDHALYGNGTRHIWNLDGDSLLPKVSSFLFQSTAPIGHDVLGQMLPKACAEAGIDKKVSTHGTLSRVLADNLRRNGAGDADYFQCGWETGRTATRAYGSKDTDSAPPRVALALSARARPILL